MGVHLTAVKNNTIAFSRSVLKIT